MKDLGCLLKSDTFHDQVVSLPLDTALPESARELLSTVRSPELAGIVGTKGFHIFEKTMGVWICFEERLNLE